MKNKNSHLAALILLLLIVVQWACAAPGAFPPTLSTTQVETLPATTPPTSTMEPPTHSAIAPTPSASPPTPSPTPTNPPPLPRTHYTIFADFDYSSHTLSVFQEVNYQNQTSKVLDEVVFVVEPARYAGAFSLSELWWGDEQTAAAYWKGRVLHLPLAKPLAPGERAGVKMAYELQLPNREGIFGYTKRQTNVGDWYPLIPPYLDHEGWLVHDPNYYKFGTLGEHLVYESADFEVTINLGKSGEDVTVVGSAPVVVRDEKYYFQTQAARNFTFSASTEYVIRETAQDGVTIRSVFFPEDVVAGEAVLTIAQESLRIYGDRFMPYQHESFTVVESLFPDGMEFDGLVYVGSEYYRSYDSTPYNYLTLITAHETAHQWWYGLVANDQALEPWLDEILATYSELIYLENAHPDAASWWFDFRVSAYAPQGWVNSTIYDFDDFRPYINAVYLRGATFLGELRKTMGDEAFFAFLAKYIEENLHKIAEGEDFLEGLEEYDTLIGAYFR